jgi:hypothetical protein
MNGTKYSSLALETRSHIDTACAAFHLNRKPQTMRAWACLKSGPIRPKRVNGRLAWSVEELKQLPCERDDKLPVEIREF